jgi:hypothetical protein
MRSCIGCYIILIYETRHSNSKYFAFTAQKNQQFGARWAVDVDHGGCPENGANVFAVELVDEEGEVGYLGAGGEGVERALEGAVLVGCHTPHVTLHTSHVTSPTCHRLSKFTAPTGIPRCV